MQAGTLLGKPAQLTPNTRVQWLYLRPRLIWHEMAWPLLTHCARTALQQERLLELPSSQHWTPPAHFHSPRKACGLKLRKLAVLKCSSTL